ncbi:hypothetical protein FOA52_012141 [Chlamydomonas sp. UWO 241]|nr:hypothetical protein FOA52_012141 [Chlamydomonas sp. UWO 241]
MEEDEELGDQSSEEEEQQERDAGEVGSASRMQESDSGGEAVEAEARGNTAGDGITAEASSSSNSMQYQTTYLKLLSSGRLEGALVPGKKKTKRAPAHGPPPPSDRVPTDTAISSPHSVHAAGLARLNAASERDVGPISLSRPNSREAAGGGGREGEGRESLSPPDTPPSKRVPPPLLPPRTNKLPTPGPGEYSRPLDLPVVDRHGCHVTACSATFGVGRQRPPQVCVLGSVVSPGPVHFGRKDGVSTLTRMPVYAFGRQPKDEARPRNAPMWNPAPGAYRPRTLASGGNLDPGVDGPITTFPRSVKLMCPATCLSGTPFISEAHARVDNAGVHAPGPWAYSPVSGAASGRAAPPAFTMCGRAKGPPDGVHDHVRRSLSPGPVYDTRTRTYLGAVTIGAQPKAVFGFASKHWAPEANLAAAPHISDAHAQRANKGVHSPGPVYDTRGLGAQLRCASPTLHSGQSDRFYED